ncbi:hypothetical protein CU097_009508 [Rhizopus azygosporus]|uniref:Transposase n=1 Tax=Rhizopus azygosporus TaxID=86630 RepID=A0A367JLW4_RHIAZ|nr:hypothetical protein CU097_009508 [Rhizopus azygosporus]
MLQQKHILKRLDDAVKTKVLELTNEMFTSEQASLKQRASELLEKLHVLPFRKLKFSTKVYYDQNDETLSVPNTTFHEPTRNKGLIRMLKKNGLTVHLIDEFKTSSKCPNCEDDLKTLKTVINPRPYRRVDMPTVKCHGLLRCKNPKCSPNGSKRKLWNRDLATALNFRKILISLRETSKRPKIFMRKQVPKPVSKKD